MRLPLRVVIGVGEARQRSTEHQVPRTVAFLSRARTSGLGRKSKAKSAPAGSHLGVSAERFGTLLTQQQMHIVD